MKRERDNRRIEKAIDELIKIKDDGHGGADIEIVLLILNQLHNQNRD
jgi:hypothetical protein